MTTSILRSEYFCASPELHFCWEAGSGGLCLFPHCCVSSQAISPRGTVTGIVWSPVELWDCSLIFLTAFSTMPALLSIVAFLLLNGAWAVRARQQSTQPPQAASASSSAYRGCNYTVFPCGLFIQFASIHVNSNQLPWVWWYQVLKIYWNGFWTYCCILERKFIPWIIFIPYNHCKIYKNMKKIFKQSR